MVLYEQSIPSGDGVLWAKFTCKVQGKVLYEQVQLLYQTLLFEPTYTHCIVNKLQRQEDTAQKLAQKLF